MSQQTKQLFSLQEINISYRPIRKSKIYKIHEASHAYQILKKVYNPETINFREECYVMYLNRANIIIGLYHHAIGSSAGCIMDIKHIIAVALKCNAEGIILSHNHPSGSLIVSRVDVEITKKIISAAKLFDIKVLDHLVVAESGYSSVLSKLL